MRMDRTTSDGLPPREEYAVTLRRSAAAIRLQPLGWLRRPQRRPEALPRPNLSVDWFRKDLRSQHRSDFPAADLRDRHAGRGGEPGRTGTAEPGADRASRSDGFGLPHDSGPRFDGGPRLRRASTVHLQHHFKSTHYHPLVLFNGKGDRPTAKLRHRAEG